MRGKNFTYAVRLQSDKPTVEKFNVSKYGAADDLAFLHGLMSACILTDSEFKHADKPITEHMAQRLYNKVEGVIKTHHYSPDTLSEVQDLQKFREFLSRTKPTNLFVSSRTRQKNLQHTNTTLLPKPTSTIYVTSSKLSSILARQQYEASVNQRNSQLEKVKAPSNSAKRKTEAPRLIDQPPLKRVCEQVKNESDEKSEIEEHYKDKPYIHFGHPIDKFGLFKPPHMPTNPDNVALNCENDLLSLMGIKT